LLLLPIAFSVDIVKPFCLVVVVVAVVVVVVVRVQTLKMRND